MVLTYYLFRIKFWNIRYLDSQELITGNILVFLTITAKINRKFFELAKINVTKPINNINLPNNRLKYKGKHRITGASRIFTLPHKYTCEVGLWCPGPPPPLLSLLIPWSSIAFYLSDIVPTPAMPLWVLDIYGILFYWTTNKQAPSVDAVILLHMGNICYFIQRFLSLILFLMHSNSF